MSVGEKIIKGEDIKAYQKCIDCPHKKSLEIAMRIIDVLHFELTQALTWWNRENKIRKKLQKRSKENNAKN